MFSSYTTELADRQVVAFDLGQGLGDPATTVPRLAVEYDSERSGVELLAALLQDPRAEQLVGLVLGTWDGEMFETQPDELVEALVAAASQLPSLTHLFFGDILYEECEVSWIQQTDLSPLWAAYPQLEYFRVRGANGLELAPLKQDHLRTLIVESGGLPTNVARAVAEAECPQLEHLELYLGDQNYGWEGDLDSLNPILQGDRFPQLRYLGLRDCAAADELARRLSKAPILERIETLDLSLGTLGDDGARALLAAPALGKLKKLDIHYHYVSPAVVEQLRQLPCEVDADNPQDEGEYGRYVSVGE